MMLGSYVLGPCDVLRSVLALSAEPSVDFIVRELRLPRARSTALRGRARARGVGQHLPALLRNPLASPDFIGISAGASLRRRGGSCCSASAGSASSVAASSGRLPQRAAVYLLAWRGGIAGYRFVLVGVGVSELMLDR